MLVMRTPADRTISFTYQRPCLILRNIWGFRPVFLAGVIVLFDSLCQGSTPSGAWRQIQFFPYSSISRNRNPQWLLLCEQVSNRHVFSLEHTFRRVLCTKKSARKREMNFSNPSWSKHLWYSSHDGRFQAVTNRACCLSILKWNLKWTSDRMPMETEV